MKKITYLLVPACMALTIGMIEPSMADPVELSPIAMDQVTGGLGSAVNVNAVAFSPVFSNTNTNATALTVVSRPDNPALGGYVEVAGGEAVAVTVGSGSTTNTSVTPVTSTQGAPGVYTTQAGGHFQNGSVSMTANVVYTTGALFHL